MKKEPSKERAQDTNAAIVTAQYPVIFLFGPPGAGKSTLGSRACEELDLTFLDIAARPIDGDNFSQMERFTRAIAERSADVVELPWELQQERQARALARKSGVPLLLWAHPEDMQARSGRKEALFTPVPRLKTRGGFGRNGTGCREFRGVHRACGETLLLVDFQLDEAVDVVTDCIDELREESQQSPADRLGLTRWVESWGKDHDTSERVTKIIVEAMARYLEHLHSTGVSPRTISGVRSDLDAAGHLVLMYDAPKGKRILEHFGRPPWVFEFERKFTDRPNLVERYRRSLEGFAHFLKESGDLPGDDE